MSIFQGMNIAASGLTAERLRMDIISDNIANANTTRTESGGPYRRKMPVFQPRGADGLQFNIPFNKDISPVSVGEGVRVTGIAEDTQNPLRSVYEPGHPDADENGYVHYPNVNTVTEMVDLITASRAYEANVSSMKAAKQMLMKGISIGR